MLVIERTPGRDILIGDHSIVTVVSIDGDYVKLGFDTRDAVKRVDTPQATMEAARVKARVSRSLVGRSRKMEKPPVFVGVRQLDDGNVDVRASLRHEVVNIAEYDISVVDENSSLGPANHEFIVLRCSDQAEVRSVRKLISSGLLDWRLYEEIEGQDASPYLLCIRATGSKQKGQGDVRYVDFGAVNLG